MQAFAYPDDKGKPPEREGRKAVGLNLTRGMIARLPNRGFYINTSNMGVYAYKVFLAIHFMNKVILYANKSV